MLSLVAKLLKALNSDASPWQLAFGFAFGCINGLTPLTGLHTLIILLLVLCFRINLTGFLLSSAVVALIAWPFTGAINQLGHFILTSDSLTPLFTGLYQSDFWQLTRFNNTAVMGGIAVGLLLFIPTLFGSRWLVTKYRTHLMAWIESLRITKILKASKFYKYFASNQGAEI